MYDLLIVGAGITAATLVAVLRERLKICVIDTRPHLGGNCFDQADKGSRIHRYGPHIFHCPSPRITQFLSHFTQWTPYTHKVTAEIEDPVTQASPPATFPPPSVPQCLSPSVPSPFTYVPFPYSRATIRALGRELSDEQILQTFFHAYSQKMWGMRWEQLPASVRGRVPKAAHEQLTDSPQYYRHPFVALPKNGYTHMLENMLDGAEIILDADPLDWTGIPARTVIYTGRPDLIPAPGQRTAIARIENLQLPYRTLDIRFDVTRPSPAASTRPSTPQSSHQLLAHRDPEPGNWHDAACLHACSLQRSWTRKTHYARMTGGHSSVTSTEFPRQASPWELTPYYPIESDQNRSRFELLSQKIKQAYPNLHLAGRLGSYRYFDMYQAVGSGLSLAKSFFSPLIPALQPLPL